MIIAVTGGTGFFGRRVVQQLVERGDNVRVLTRRPSSVPHGVTAVDGGVSDTASLARLCAGADRLIHMASLGVQARDRSMPEMIATNVRGTVNALEAAIAAGVGATVMSGTVLEYRGGTAELTEDASTDPVDPYGATKSAAGILARTLARAADHPLVYLRVASMLGPKDDPGKLVPQTLRAVLAGEPVALTSGTQVREWLHVDDGAAAVVAALRTPNSSVINVGTGVGLSVRAFLERLCDAVGGSRALLRFGAKEMRTGEPPRLVMSVASAKRLLGWSSRRSLDDLVAELASSVKG